MAVRAHTLVENYEVVSRFDEAVDADAPEFEHKWKLYRDGAGDLPLKAGVSATRFQMRHVTSTERVYLLELYQGEERGLMLAAAAIALVGAKGLEDASGKPVEVRRAFTDIGPLRIQHASKETMDALPVDVLLELGSVALDRMRPRPS